MLDPLRSLTWRDAPRCHWPVDTAVADGRTDAARGAG